MRNIANSKLAFLAIVAVVAVAMVAVYMKGHLDGSVGKGLQLTPEAQAAKAKVSPVKARGDRGVYYPNTENLGRNEIRVIACGTGMPTPRPAQAAACFLMELGNGDKFIFDIGAGSTERLFALQIPTAFLDKVFYRASAWRPFRRSWSLVCGRRDCRPFLSVECLGAERCDAGARHKGRTRSNGEGG